MCHSGWALACVLAERKARPERRNYSCTGTSRRKDKTGKA